MYQSDEEGPVDGKRQSPPANASAGQLPASCPLTYNHGLLILSCRKSKFYQLIRPRLIFLKAGLHGRDWLEMRGTFWVQKVVFG